MAIWESFAVVVAKVIEGVPSTKRLTFGSFMFRVEFCHKHTREEGQTKNEITWFEVSFLISAVVVARIFFIHVFCLTGRWARNFSVMVLVQFQSSSIMYDCVFINVVISQWIFYRFEKWNILFLRRRLSHSLLISPFLEKKFSHFIQQLTVTLIICTKQKTTFVFPFQRIFLLSTDSTFEWYSHAISLEFVEVKRIK